MDKSKGENWEPLDIDVAFFANIPRENYKKTNRNLPNDSKKNTDNLKESKAILKEPIEETFKGFSKVCNDLYKELSYEDAVDISLIHHHSPDTVQVSALFTNHTPNISSLLYATKEAFERRVIVLGETTMRGGGNVAVFDGRHVQLHRQNLSERVLSLYITNKRLKIVTGVQEVDVFFNLILYSVSSKKDDELAEFYELLGGAIDSVRSWLHKRRRAEFRGETRMLDSKVITKWGKLIEECERKGINVDGAKILLEDLEKRKIRLPHFRLQKEDMPEPLPMKGKRGTVSDQLKTQYEELQSRIRYIATVNATLFGASILSAAAFAYATRADRSLLDDSIFLALTFHVMFTFLALFVFACPLFIPLLQKCREGKMKKKANEYVDKMNRIANFDEQVIVGINDRELSMNVLKSKTILRWVQISSIISMMALAGTIISYASYYFSYITVSC